MLLFKATWTHQGGFEIIKPLHVEFVCVRVYLAVFPLNPETLLSSRRNMYYTQHGVSNLIFSKSYFDKVSVAGRSSTSALHWIIDIPGEKCYNLYHLTHWECRAKTHLKCHPNVWEEKKKFWPLLANLFSIGIAKPGVHYQHHLGKTGKNLVCTGQVSMFDFEFI